MGVAERFPQGRRGDLGHARLRPIIQVGRGARPLFANRVPTGRLMSRLRLHPENHFVGRIGCNPENLARRSGIGWRLMDFSAQMGSQET